MDFESWCLTQRRFEFDATEEKSQAFLKSWIQDSNSQDLTGSWILILSVTGSLSIGTSGTQLKLGISLLNEQDSDSRTIEGLIRQWAVQKLCARCSHPCLTERSLFSDGNIWNWNTSTLYPADTEADFIYNLQLLPKATSWEKIYHLRKPPGFLRQIFMINGSFL